MISKGTYNPYKLYQTKLKTLKKNKKTQAYNIKREIKNRRSIHKDQQEFQEERTEKNGKETIHEQ